MCIRDRIQDPEDEDTAFVEPADESVEEPSNDEMPSLDEGTPVKSGCNAAATGFSPLAFFATLLFVFFRKENQ